MDRAADKQRAAVLGAGIRLGAANDDRIETVPVLDHVLVALEQLRVEQPDEHPEAEMVALVRCGRQENEVAAMVANGLGEFEIFGFLDPAAVPVHAQMVRLVEDHQVPGRRGEEFFDPGRALDRVDRDDQAIVLGKGVGLAVGDIPLAAEHLEIEMKHLVQFPAPVFHQAGGNDHDGPGQFASGRQLTQNERSLDGLAQPDLVGDQESLGTGIGHPVDEHHLVRQQVDLGGGQRGRAFHERQFFRFDCQPKLLQPIRCSRHHALDDLVEPVRRRPQRIGRHLPLPVSAKEDRDIPRGFATDDNAVTQLVMADLQARLEFRKCVRHSSQWARLFPVDRLREPAVSY